ncbi:hypothetical protein BGZ65_012632, partial [Modicella reniformis]
MASQSLSKTQEYFCTVKAKDWKYESFHSFVLNNPRYPNRGTRVLWVQNLEVIRDNEWTLEEDKSLCVELLLAAVDLNSIGNNPGFTQAGQPLDDYEPEVGHREQTKEEEGEEENAPSIGSSPEPGTRKRSTKKVSYNFRRNPRAIYGTRRML